MQFWYMNETAYPNLPPEDDYESVRVTLPNRILDPEVAATWWDDYFEEYQAASELGFDMMVNEHHGTATCMTPAVPITAGILARITSKGRILILGNPIANRRDPVRVAEEMAMLDLFSRGRLEVGFVRGVPYEISATNTMPVNMVPRFWEAHDLIKQAWTSHDGPFPWQGRFFDHRQVNIWPRPLQQPHPPIWIASLSAGSAVAVGEHGYVCATFLTGVENTRKIFAGYREGWESAREDEIPSDRFAYLGLVFVGETDDEGMAGAEQLLWYLQSNKAPGYFMDPPGYRPAAARAAEFGKGFRAGLRTLPMETLIERGVVFAGSPDTVTGQIERFHDAVGGFGHFLMMGRAGHLRKEQTISSLRLFAEEVRPRLNKRELELAQPA
jgi:alkanesulfonate monooxygenase SsuD/methylene tetrahydromethanopterin reductase-like flavin-dependent oxidoreductase (luciferase family)